MIDKAHLQGKTVHVRLVALPVPLPATVTFVEDDGLWLAGQDLVIRLVRDGGGLPGVFKNPVVYVPFSQILWLVAENS